ncbi:MAG: hypothetical protein P4L85_19025 [Paludisphaera borealis]|nr:hypothetical protein [Paludisphaera borealis]
MAEERTSPWKWALCRALAVMVMLSLIERETWTCSASELTTATIMVMVVVSIVSFLFWRRSAFWIGFVVVGWAWLAISLGTSLGPDLPETGWIDAVRSRVGSAPESIRSFDKFEEMDQKRRDLQHRDAFRTAGHCLVSLALACLCGDATRLLFATEDPDREDWVTPDGSLFRPNPRDDRDSP